jgi:phage terminase small subunit
VKIVNAKQRKFCDEYLIDLNATQAAIRAGYSEKTARQVGQRLLTYVDISAYINEQLERIHNERTADAQEVIEYLTSVMRGEHTEQALQLVGDGVQEICDIEVSAKDRLKAAELIGKRYGIFTDKTDLTVAQPIVVSGGEALED